MKKIEVSKKIKTTVYLSEQDKTLLNEIFIKRLRNHNKTDISSLFCEGIRLLYKKDIESCPE